MCLAIPGKIISIADNEPVIRTGKVSFGPVVKQTSLVFVPQAQVGDYVIVHAGFAINTIDEKEAAAVFDYLDQISPGDPENNI